MQTAEFVRVLLFLGLIGLIYFMAARVVIGRVAARKSLAISSGPYPRWLERTVLVLAVSGLAAAAYGYFVEPYWPSIVHIQIKSKVPIARPVRLVQISDLHCDPKPRLETKLPDIVSQQKPDAILFTGDCINSPEGLPIFKECMTRLAAIAPVFAVRGNWDTAFWSRIDLFGDTGVRQLDGDAVPLSPELSSIRISGVSVGNEKRVGPMLAAIPAETFKIFLYHYPDLVPELSNEHIDLYCAGHTHGGQVAMPFYGALVTLSKFGKRYESGLYQLNDGWLYVNRGIGMEGGSAPRVRFCARPEITVIEVSPER